MQLELASEPQVQNCPRNDPVELLAGTVNVRRPRKHDGEVVGPLEAQEAHVARRTGNRVRRTGVVRRVLAHGPLAAAVHLWSRNMHVLLEEPARAQLIVQLYVRDYV